MTPVALLALAAPLAGCASTTAEAPEPPGRDSAEAAATVATPPAPSPDPDAPTGWGPTVGELEQARTAVTGMTVEQQAATVLMPGFFGHDPASPEPAEADRNETMHRARTILDALALRSHGALFLRPEVIADAPQVARLTAELHAAADVPPGAPPLLLGIDQEGGVVQRLKVGVPVVPSAASVGATGDVRHARQVARRNGAVLRELGVTMVFAPVADVDPDGRSTIGSRAYSSDPEVAAEMVTATVEGYLRAGVIPVVKHFPGLGSVEGDSHWMRPVQRKSLAALRSSDLVPFAAAVRAGAPAVMTGHVEMRAIDRGLPASLSRPVVEGLLREELGFEGVVITDSQGMGPIHAVYGPGEGAVRSLLAGNDLVLNSPRPIAAWRSVLAAVEEGRLPTERLAEAATRVTALRLLQQRLAAERD